MRVNTKQYLYGFVPSDAPDPPPDLYGIDGHRIRLLDVGGFSAAASTLDAADYSPSLVEDRLSDLAWLGPRGVEHERVVTWFADHATIVPARLLTLFSSDAALLDEARQRARTVADHLERFRDRREWDLKVSYEIDGIDVVRRSERAAEIAAEIAGAAPGRSYLLQRKLAEVVREEAPAVAHALAAELFEELAALADEVTELEIPSHEEALPVVLDAALLVHDDRIAQLRGLATRREAELRTSGVHATLTGPWAPYRFMADPDDA
jgi:hypothetical protein